MTAIVFACVLCCYCGAASAQTFSVDLHELTAIYDELFPERTAVAVWDTLAPYDFDNVLIGNQHHKVPSFLKTNVLRTRTIEDWAVVPGYRVRFTIPLTASWERQQRTVGALTLPVPRDLDIAGLEIEFTPMENVVTEIRRQSLEDAWRETVRLFISTQEITGSLSRQGITINIPVPMPRQLESIFGPSDKTHITISGRESITISGETRVVDPFIGVEGRQSQSLFPSLDMRQELDVRLTGSIGDKVNIQIDHSSQATDDANQISVNYVGYDDDVIQRIELGNTSLSLPGSQLVSVSTQSRGLFGIKMLATLGATDMTFIASKQDAQTSSASFSPTGGSIGQAESRTLRDIDYVQNKYFYFDHPLVFVGATTDSIIDVYRSVEPRDLQADPELIRFPGIAFVDSNGFGTDINQAMTNIAAGLGPRKANVRKDFQLLDFGADYSFVLDLDDNVVGVELSQALNDPNRALAVRYTNTASQRIGGAYSTYGIDVDFVANQQDTIVLELLWSGSALARPDNQFGWTWGYMMRHIYNLGLSNIDPATFTLEIEDLLQPRLDATFPVGSTVPYIRIFGLDRFDQSGLPGFDGRVDLSTGVIDINRGILSFLAPIDAAATLAEADFQVQGVILQDPDGLATPQFTGFAPDTLLVTLFTDSLFQFSGPYEDQWTKSRRIYREFLNDIDRLDVNQYLIRVTAVSTSKTFQLDAFNIIENSEVVTLDGQRLARGSDYDIDYISGQVTLKGSAIDLLSPDSKINVDYDFKPLGGGQSANLIGFSSISRLGDTVIGTTLLYESKAASKERPRIGEEPTRALVGGINGNFSHRSDILTDLVNFLPFVDTDAQSSLTINGEAALSIPDPNTRGEASIDDFEGVEDSDRIGLSRRSWYWASTPVIPTADESGQLLGDTDRGDFVWYNIEPELAVTRQDLNPELNDNENSTIQSFDIEVNPRPAPGDTTTWVGVMTGFGRGGLDLTNGQFIEIWVNDFTQDPLQRRGTLRIDMGTIDEDFWEPEKNEFNDEDTDRDGFAAAFDDTGLDGLFNQDEPCAGCLDPADPNGDDLDLSRFQGRFIKVNGTEGNRAYDTEDLDGNTQLDELNSFFSYEVDLAAPAAVDVYQEFPTYEGFNDPGHRHDAWRKYRIRLSDAKIVASSGVQPRFDQIRHIRIWFKDVDEVLPDSVIAADTGNRIQIAEFKIQGNRWIIDGVRDFSDNLIDTLTVGTDITLGVISNKTDPGVYFPPISPREDATGVQDKESSLALVYDSLAAGTQARIRKQFPGNGIDLSQYKELHFWVNTDSLRSNIEYYYRMGTNENNYYEVGLPLTAEYFPSEPSWHRVSVLLADITNLKFDIPDSTGVISGVVNDISEPGLSYPVRMMGVPSLFSVRFLYAGVRNVNPDPLSTPAIGRVWINDIYVGTVRRDIDHAERLGVSLNLGGGIISFVGTWNRTGPDFRSLRQRRGSNALTQSIGVNGKTNIRHFLPLGGLSVPVTLAYSRFTSNPKFVPNSDTEIVEESTSDSLKTTRVTRSFSTAIQKRGSKRTLLKYTIDKMTTNFSISQSRSAGPASRDTTTTMSGTLGYQITWSGRKNVKLFRNTRFRWWLNSLSIRTAANRRETLRSRNLDGEFRPDPRQFSAGLVNTGSANYQPFESISSTFNMTINRDVALPHEWLGINVGTETARREQLRVGWKPNLPFIDIFAPDLDVTSSYSENSSPNVRRIGDPKGTRNVDVSRQGSLKIRFDIGRYLAGLFKKLGWDVGGADEPVRGEPPSRTQPQDSTSAAADTTETKKADPKLALRQIGRLLTDIRRIEASFNQRMSNNYRRIPDRPVLAYQLGLTSDTGIDGYEDPERLTESLGMSVRSGLQVTQGFDIQAAYTRNISDTDFRNSKTRSLSTTWPDVQINWTGLEHFALFRPYFSSVRANINFKIFEQETGRRNEDPDNSRRDFSITPALQFSFKNEINSNLSVSYAKNTTNTRGSSSENTNLSVSLDFRKIFRGGAGFRIPLPFLNKRVDWSSQLETNLSLAYSQTGGKRFVTGSAFFEPIPRTTSLRVSPAMTYNFTDALSGRMFIDYGRQYNEATDQTITTLRLGVNAVFTF